MVNFGKLKIHSSFFVFFILIIALGFLKQFFFLMAATTMHELTHVATAWLFGLKTDGILITPIGETAYINGFDGLPAKKKYAVLLAGPMANIIVSLLIFSFFNDAELRLFGYISLAIGIFNLLPIYPFDGGKLLFILFGNSFGILSSIKHISLLTRAGACLLIAAGFVQLVLFPFNFSLFAIGIFTVSLFEREKGAMAMSYYRCMLFKNARLSDGLRIRHLALSGECMAQNAEKKFTWDFFHIIYVIKSGKVSACLTEAQIFEAEINSKGRLKLLDIIENNDIIENANAACAAKYHFPED